MTREGKFMLNLTSISAQKNTKLYVYVRPSNGKKIIYKPLRAVCLHSAKKRDFDNLNPFSLESVHPPHAKGTGRIRYDKYISLFTPDIFLAGKRIVSRAPRMRNSKRYTGPRRWKLENPMFFLCRMQYSRKTCFFSEGEIPSGGPTLRCLAYSRENLDEDT